MPLEGNGESAEHIAGAAEWGTVASDAIPTN
jgi:hypothetical protein